MKINEIYKKLGIPPNLQEHMFRVCGIVSLIQRHWKGEENIDWDLTRKMALLHDLGNIVKFDYEKHPEFLGDERKNIEYWKKIQGEIIKKYGSDDNEATRKMLLEIGIDQETADTIFDKRFVNSVHTSQSKKWFLIIVYYADLRALPLRIGSLEERIADIRERYTNYVSRPDFEDLVSACETIEKQIQTNINASVTEINEKTVNEVINRDRLLMENLEI